MAAEYSLSKQISNITKCPICLETLKELKQLQTLRKDNNHRDDIPCPVCRKLFVVPAGGVIDLTNNFFTIELLHVNQLEISTNGRETSVISGQVVDVRDIPSDVKCVKMAVNYCELHPMEEINCAAMIVKLPHVLRIT